MSTSHRTRGYGWFLYPGFIVLVVFFFGMLFWNIGISMLKWPGFGPAKFIGFENYTNIFTNEDFWYSWLHAFYYVIPFSLIPTLLGLVLAVSSYETFVGKWLRKIIPVARTGFFLPQVVPIAVSGVIWLWMLDESNGVINQMLTNISGNSVAIDWVSEPITALFALSLFMIWLQTGFAYVVFLAGLSRLDPAVVEASHLDGANWWQRLRWITAPSLTPEAFVVLLFLSVGALKVFAPVFYLTFGGPRASTSSPATFAINSFFGGQYVGYGSAVTTMLAVLIGLVVAVVFGIAKLRSKASEKK